MLPRHTQLRLRQTIRENSGPYRVPPENSEKEKAKMALLPCNKIHWLGKNNPTGYREKENKQRKATKVVGGRH